MGFWKPFLSGSMIQFCCCLNWLFCLPKYISVYQPSPPPVFIIPSWSLSSLHLMPWWVRKFLVSALISDEKVWVLFTYLFVWLFIHSFLYPFIHLWICFFSKEIGDEMERIGKMSERKPLSDIVYLKSYFQYKNRCVRF